MTAPGATTPEAPGEGQSHQIPRHTGVILAVLCSAQTILAVDVTVVNVANASIERALGFTSANLQWTVTAYSLTFGGFLLLGGRMADLFGRRRLFLAGITGFALASLAAGSSHNMVELIGARAAQGLCAAVISPAVLSLLAATFPEGRPRQRAYGMWATAGSVGGLLGFLFGGFITTLLGWRWIFFINVPIAAIAISAAVFLLPRTEERVARARRLDVPGAISVTAALALVIYGLGEAQSTSWTSTSTLIALCLAPVLLIVFAVVEHKTPEPLLPFALLRRRAAFSNLIATLQQSVGAATAFLAPLYMQQIWGYSAGRAGAATLPLPIGFGIGARLSSRLISRLGVKRLVCIGFLLVGAGLAYLARSPVHASYFTTFMPALFVRSVGQGMVVVPIVVTATSGVKKEDQGVAAGLYNMSQQLGGALGLAVIATVASAAAGVGGFHIAAEAHGIRIGFLTCAVIAVVGCILSLTALKTPIGDRPGLKEELAEIEEVGELTEVAPVEP